MEPKVSVMEKINRLIAFLLVILPVTSFAINLVSWMRFGVDVPFLDDMRQYASADAGRMDWAYITYPANDTLYPIGLIFDALAFRYLDGNSIAYQLISMFVVLGGILLLQWKLLTVSTSSKVIRALAFAATIFMIQPDSYWGWQNMAFHQAVPVLCSLWIMYLVLSKQNSRISAALIFLLATVSGFTYTSGAFANLAILVGLIILRVAMGSATGARIRLCAMAMAIPTALSVAAQLWVLIWVQHGTHRPDAPMAYPWESDFWYFMLGKVGRALMLPTQMPELSMSLSIAVLVLTPLLAMLAISEAIKNKPGTKIWNASVVYLCIFGVVALYLCIIAAGRTNLRPETLALPTDIFIYGYGRFHFFWVCMLWPWIIAFIMERMVSRNPSEATRPEIPLISLLVIMTMIFNSKIMDHTEFYRSTKQIRLSILSCLSKGVSHGVPFECPALHPGLNMLNVYYKSLDAGASYTGLVAVTPIPLWSNDPPPIFRLTDSEERVAYHNATVTNEGMKGVVLNTFVDPMMEITAGDSNSLKGCTVLQVSGAYHLDAPNFAQLFYLPTGAKSFSEQSTEGHQLPAGDGEFNFNVHSKTGFENLLRLDPVISSAPIAIRQLEVRCVVGPIGSIHI